MVGLMFLDEHEPAAALLGRDAGRARAGEGVEDDTAGRAERLDDRLERLDRLLGRVQVVPRVPPWQHVGHGDHRRHRRALGEQVRLLVAALQMAGTRGVALGPDDVPAGREACHAPRGKELVGLAPAVEAHAVGVGLEHAAQLGEGRVEPAGVVVVGHDAARAVLVSHEVRRVGEHEVHRRIRQRAEHLEAIAENDPVEERSHRGVCG